MTYVLSVGVNAAALHVPDMAQLNSQLPGAVPPPPVAVIVSVCPESIATVGGDCDTDNAVCTVTEVPVPAVTVGGCGVSTPPPGVVPVSSIVTVSVQLLAAPFDT